MSDEPTSSAPVPRTTACWLLWTRADLPREQAMTYWAGPHRVLVSRMKHLDEYRQLHFSATDHGFWPGPPGIGTAVPTDWRIDGMPEVTFESALAPLKSTLSPSELWAIYQDESKAFDRMLCNPTGPNGGRWFRSSEDVDVGARTVVLVRRRRDVRFSDFRRFIHGVLGAALDHTPGVLELRTHSFLPYTKLVWWTPGVAHENPTQRRYHAAVVLGAADREALDRILGSPELAATRQAQADHCLALHAYSVDGTYTGIRDGKVQL